MRNHDPDGSKDEYRERDPVLWDSPEPVKALHLGNLRSMAILLIFVLAVFDVIGLLRVARPSLVSDNPIAALLNRINPAFSQPAPKPTIREFNTPAPPVGVAPAVQNAPTAVATASALKTPVSSSSPRITPVGPPGIYVANLRLDPETPKRQQDINFHVTFVNTTGISQARRWVVYFFRPDNLKRPFGQTSADRLLTVPAGVTESAAFGTWKLMSPGPCEDILARVAWLEENGNQNFFTTTDGRLFERGIRICP